MTDNTAEKKDPAATEEIDAILDNIKETMNSDEKANEDVLELTEKIDSKDESDAANDEPAEQLNELLDDDKKEGTKDSKANTEKKDDLMDKIDEVQAQQEGAPSTRIEASNTPATADSTLVRNDIANESRQALKNLIDRTEHDDSLRVNRDTTLEQLTKELLKPQLSEWLNNNLQTIVEKIVQKEIRKILPND